MIETWADRDDYEGLRAAPVECPCCGRMRAADMVVRVADDVAKMQSDRRAALTGAMRVAEMPEYMCTGELARLHRSGLVGRGQFPGRK